MKTPAPTPFLADGKTPRCCKTKYGYPYNSQCGSRGKVVRDGKDYCGTHDPVARKLREEAKAAERKNTLTALDVLRTAEMEIEALNAAKLSLWPELVAALAQVVAIADRKTDVFYKAHAILARAEKLK